MTCVWSSLNFFSCSSMTLSLCCEIPLLIYTVYLLFNVGYWIYKYNPESRLVIFPSIESSEIHHFKKIISEGIIFSKYKI